MAQYLDYPSINVSAKTNEENLQVTKSYLNGLADQFNYIIANLEARIESLESQIQNMKGED